MGGGSVLSEILLKFYFFKTNIGGKAKENEPI